jgi:DNA-binding transcriptional MerR regulator
LWRDYRGGVRIGELAEATGSTPRALRHYEQAGLISSNRARNGYRVYDGRAVVRVRNIRYLLAAGLTLDDVQVFLPCLDGDVATAPPSGNGVRVAFQRLAVLDQRIAAQTEARDRLANALRHVTGPGSRRSERSGSPTGDGSACRPTVTGT